MLKKRLIPQLLINDDRLIKTYKYSKERYIGDPLNAVSIFNEKKADEIFILDINRSSLNKLPNFNYIGQLASECFMPFGYGGAIDSIDTAKRIFDLGVEKVILQSNAFKNQSIIPEISKIYGSQSVVVSLDLKKNIFNENYLYSKNAKIKNPKKIKEYILKFIELGAGEILLNSTFLEGTFRGLNLNLINEVKNYCSIPLLINGGLNSLSNAKDAFKMGADGVVAGSFFVFYGKHKAVLISYPSEDDIFNL